MKCDKEILMKIVINIWQDLEQNMRKEDFAKIDLKSVRKAVQMLLLLRIDIFDFAEIIDESIERQRRMKVKWSDESSLIRIVYDYIVEKVNKDIETETNKYSRIQEILILDEASSRMFKLDTTSEDYKAYRRAFEEDEDIFSVLIWTELTERVLSFMGIIEEEYPTEESVYFKEFA